MSKKLGISGMHYESLSGGVFGTVLWRMAQKLPPEPKREPKPKKVDGRTLRAQQVLSDETLAQWRGEYESGRGGSIKQMAEKYGVTYDRMYMLMTYQARPLVKPAQVESN